MSAGSRRTAPACPSPRSSSSCSRARRRRSALALELDALAPLRLETRSKSARGYALAAGMPPAWHKAEPPALEADATVDRAIQAILRSCLQHWCANEAAALDGSDPEGVHQMRVALRRLRSAFSVFGRLIDPAQRAWLSDEAKTIVNGLGPARDWDVFLAELLAPVRAARQDDAGLSGWPRRPRRRGRRVMRMRAPQSGPAPTPVTFCSWDAGSKPAAGAISRRSRA